MSAGIKANNDGSAAIQVGGTDRVTLSSAGVMEVPAGITADLTGNAATSTKLSTASGSAPSYSARAWVNFNGTGTVAIRAAGNVSSITDNGVGDYTVNFTTAMPDANYSTVVSADSFSGFLASLDRVSNTLTSSVRVYSYNGAATPTDHAMVCVSIFR